MNGLRYHYQHSGDHGAIGLALLASGQHECLSHAHKGGASRHSTPNNSNGNSTSRAQQEMMQTQQFQQQQQVPAPPPQQMVYAQQGQQQQQQAQQYTMHTQQMTHSPLSMSGNYVSGDMYMSR